MTEDNVRKLDDCKGELNNIETWINNNPLHSNVRYLIAYAVVKASGAIEIVFKSMLYDFLSENAKPETQAYLTKMIIDSSVNPKTGNMIRLLDQIDSSKKTLFDNNTKNIQAKADLNSLVVLRNDIAHGRTINATIGNIKRYFESGVTILNILDNILYPSPPQE